MKLTFLKTQMYRSCIPQLYWTVQDCCIARFPISVFLPSAYKSDSSSVLFVPLIFSCMYNILEQRKSTQRKQNETVQALITIRDFGIEGITFALRLLVFLLETLHLKIVAKREFISYFCFFHTPTFNF